MKRLLAAVVAALALSPLAASAAALATPAAANMKISTTVIAACKFSLTDFDLGNYDASVGISGASHTIDFRCTNGTTFQLFLRNFTGKLTAGANQLNYVINDPTATPWVNGTAITAVGTGAAQSKTFTVDVPANQFVPALVYSETVQFALEL